MSCGRSLLDLSVMNTPRKSSSQKNESQGKTTNRKPSISENHAKAPWAASIVKEYRDVFGEDQVAVLQVIEGGVSFDRTPQWISKLLTKGCSKDSGREP